MQPTNKVPFFFTFALSDLGVTVSVIVATVIVIIDTAA